MPEIRMGAIRVINETLGPANAGGGQILRRILRFLL
jgi:hypothetical protein